MPKPPIESLPLEETCQYFEFLLKTAHGTEMFPFTVPGPDAKRLASLFAEPDPLPDECFITFTSVPGRVVQLNSRFLVGLSRLDHPGRMSDQTADASPTEALILFVDGLKEPLTYDEFEPGWLEEMSAVLQEHPAVEFLTFPEAEDLRTRFFPSRNIILLDRIASSRETPEKI